MGFGPRDDIRNFNGDDYVGKLATLELGRIQNGRQQCDLVSISGVMKKGMWQSPFAGCFDWIPRQYGKKEGDRLRRRIKKVELIEHANGGRSTTNRAKTYAEFFDEERKQMVQAMWGGGLMARIMRGGGDPDRADLIITFKDFKLENTCWDFVAPEEWYSEMHADDYRFQFEAGFYANAEEAIERFTDKPHDDLFGERYFPVIVFPFSKENIRLARDIGGWAKACSKPIATGEHVVVGTRCKPSEFAGVIERTYENGGQVAKAMDWNWD